MLKSNTAHLILEDGTQFDGFSFGAERSVSGEVVFSTAMSGYPESLTDPSYEGQILVMTYPLIGNYGVPDDKAINPETGLPLFVESDRVHIKGLVITDYSFEYSHWNAVKSLSDWLKENDVPGIFGVDTRQITKIIRERGVMLGKLVQGENFEQTAKNLEFHNPNKENLVAKVSCTEVTEYGPLNADHKKDDSSYKRTIVLIDCGAKNNIIRSLLDRPGTKVIRVPWDYDFTDMAYDGLMLTNGPGDPALCGAAIENIKKSMDKHPDRPIFGICLGNQLLSWAAGATTYKMKYGHRSHNQPALEVGTNHAVITSQNHGYAVDPSNLDPKEWVPYYTNLNDGTIEGIKHVSKPFCSVQFHPEATSGPVDTSFLFDQFIERVDQYKK